MQIWKYKYPNIMVEIYCIASFPRGEGSFPKVFPLNHSFGHHFVAKLKMAILLWFATMWKYMDYIYARNLLFTILLN